MKRLCLFALFTLVVSAENKLKIHLFNVGQGDSQLIIYPSGYTVLIDVGTGSTNILEKMQNLLGEKPHINVFGIFFILLISPSHLSFIRIFDA